MEHPPGSLDDLQPQDVSTSSMPVVIDLSRKEEECILSPAPHDALRMVKSPGWYPHSGATSPGLHFSETGSSDAMLQSGDQIQPDNALSHTTVTLSYVSRSHVFSTHDSLSQHLPLYSVSPISRFSLHPHCDSDNSLGETSYALNQHYSEQAEEPMNLATQTDLFHPFSQAQVGPENDAVVFLVQEPVELNGDVNGGAVSSDEFSEKLLQDEDAQTPPPETRNGLENGDSWSSSGAQRDSSPETIFPVRGEDEESRSSDVLLICNNQDVVVASDRAGTRAPCSLSGEYRSPLEDPVSPSATSLEDVFLLPQTSCSPSADSSYPENNMSSDTQPCSDAIHGSRSLDSRSETGQPTSQWKSSLEPLIHSTNDARVSEVLENKPNSVNPHMNGNANALERTVKERKLPVRAGRGTRLEAIVMNINSSRYKVSGCILTSKQTSASKPTTRDSTLCSTKRSKTLCVQKRRGKVKKTKQKVVIKKKDKCSNIKTDGCKASTSVPKLNNTKQSHSDTLPKRLGRSKREPVNPPQTRTMKSKRKLASPSNQQLTVNKIRKKDPDQLPQPEPSVENNVSRFSPPPPPGKPPKNSPGKTQSKSPGSRASPSTKTKVARAKRRRKKCKPSQPSSIFSPKEPEIKLKYVTYKEEKRDVRLDSFSPFVHVQRQQSSPSLCTIINYPEEVKVQDRKGHQQQALTSAFISAAVPSTSCLRLGRLSTHSQYRRPLICCLCGRSANAMDLGDLHGPYYPEGYRLSPKAPAMASGLKEDEDDYSDSDSSSSSVRVRPWALMQGAPLKQKGLLGSHRWAGNRTGSPAAKRAWSDTGPADVEDWYSPPVLPVEPCEYWLHEDCGIWSAGVFLVKGKVYGLEEAVKVAQESICSACHQSGASLGCFFKGCANKYHYRCALEADCVLIEENFSMKCKKHKNKTFKTPPGSRQDNR